MKHCPNCDQSTLNDTLPVVEVTAGGEPLYEGELCPACIEQLEAAVPDQEVGLI